ncbi:MAG TPA: hypothetical protein VGJ05_19585 [Fimbriiglobus sp.]
MASYEPPVDRLLKIGRPRSDTWEDYSQRGIGPEHVPDLLRLLQDEALARTGNGPEIYAQVHAWRALAQLKAEAAIEPLLDLLAGQEDEDEWDDWITEGVPEALGRIGPAALEPTAICLERTFTLTFAPTYYGRALSAIALRYPETRDEVVRRLTAFLDRAADNDPGANGFFVSYLKELEATEAWSVIERAFATGNVDEMVAGDAADAKYELGLGPMPVREIRCRDVGSIKTPLSAKARALKRARKKKTAKKRHKRSQ